MNYKIRIGMWLVIIGLLMLLCSCTTFTPLPLCEDKVPQVMKEVVEAKECLAMVDQSPLASSRDVSPSLQITLACTRTVEFIGMINVMDKKLMAVVKKTPNTKYHGQCKQDQVIYEVVNTSVDAKELRAEVGR